MFLRQHGHSVREREDDEASRDKHLQEEEQHGKQDRRRASRGGRCQHDEEASYGQQQKDVARASRAMRK